MWKLYKRKLGASGTEYCWVNSDLIIHNRIVWNIGFLPFLPNDRLNGFPLKVLKDDTIDPDFPPVGEWRKVNTEMTQEELSKGYLC